MTASPSADLGRRIFDAHVHVEQGLDNYDLAIHGKNVIFNYVQSYRALHEAYRRDSDSVTLIVDLGDDFEFVRGEIEAGRIHALKVHSRVSQIAEKDWNEVAQRLERVPEHVPVIVDAFYYGKELDYQPSLPGIINLLSRFPSRKFVVAHSGGYRIIEYFYHLREFKNCFYELALTIQFLEDSSLIADLKKLIKFTDKSRVLYGSDYPFASPALQCAKFLEICTELGLKDDDIDRMLFANAAELFHGRKI